MSESSEKLKILVFHIGHLGDTVMILPAIQAVKEYFGHAEYTLLTDKFIGKNRVSAAEIFERAGYFDRILCYPKSNVLSKTVQFFSMFWLVPRLKHYKFDALVYLVPSQRSRRQIERDRKLFRLANIRDFYGMDGFYTLQSENGKMPVHEADMLLARLKVDGLAVSSTGQAKFPLNLGEEERLFVDNWFQSHNDPHRGKILVGFAPGSKMQSKRWSAANFSIVGKKLIKKYDIFPIVVGAAEEKELGRMLVKSWKRGLNAAGALTIRQSAEVLRRCDFYIGNDSGPMHLAAAVNTRCVAIFSARDIEGKWYPYGAGHYVFRKRIQCQGCMLENCDHRTCLKRISPLTVFRTIEGDFQDLFNSKVEKK